MSRRADKIDKLLRLAESPNKHEAALAREEAARLQKGLPVPVSTGGPDPAYPHQLPGAFRVPTPIGGR